jgi:SAM-dependent methyltransferase
VSKNIENTGKPEKCYEELWGRKAKGEEFRVKCFLFASQSALSSVIKDIVPVNKDTLILDIGCGSAIYTPILCKDRGCKFVGIDISYTAIKQLLNNIQFNELCGNEIVGVGDMTYLPFKPASFDLVICVGSLEHIPDDRKALREFTRVLKSGGYLFLLIPNSISRMLPIFRPLEKRFDQCGHLREYTVEDLSNLISSEGLNTANISSRDFFGFWLIFGIERFMGSFFTRNPIGRLINRAVFESHIFTKVATYCIALFLKAENKLLKRCKFGMNNYYVARKQ